jgi:hypothetical protein
MIAIVSRAILRRPHNPSIRAAAVGISIDSSDFQVVSRQIPNASRRLDLRKSCGRSNCQTLFAIGCIHSDRYIRDVLDEADPALLQPCFERLETLLAEPPMRQAFGRLGGRTLIAWEGTEFFRSQKLGCPHFLTRKRANGRSRVIIVCCLRRSWRPAIPRSCR